MPMGLNTSWQSYMNMILDCLQSRKYYEAIMDDLLLFTPTKKSHIAKLKDFIKALLKNGLKISSKKCQLFRKKLQYVANTISIKDRSVCIKLLRSRLEAIQKLNLQQQLRVVEVLQNGKLFKFILSRITEMIKTNI